MNTYKFRFKGGPGSGNHGHKGIPGHRGGSLPRGESGADVPDNSAPGESTPSGDKPIKSNSRKIEKARDYLEAMHANVEMDDDMKRDVVYLSNKYLGTSVDEEDASLLFAIRQAKKLKNLPEAQLLKIIKGDWETLSNAGQYLGDA